MDGNKPSNATDVQVKSKFIHFDLSVYSNRYFMIKVQINLLILPETFLFCKVYIIFLFI